MLRSICLISSLALVGHVFLTGSVSHDQKPGRKVAFVPFLGASGDSVNRVFHAALLGHGYEIADTGVIRQRMLTEETFNSFVRQVQNALNERNSGAVAFYTTYDAAHINLIKESSMNSDFLVMAGAIHSKKITFPSGRTSVTTMGSIIIVDLNSGISRGYCDASAKVKFTSEGSPSHSQVVGLVQELMECRGL